MPTFEALSKTTGIPASELVHHALVRWVSAGAEALMSIHPQVLDELMAAGRREDWTAVTGILDWLDCGTRSNARPPTPAEDH